MKSYNAYFVVLVGDPKQKRSSDGCVMDKNYFTLALVHL